MSSMPLGTVDVLSLPSVSFVDARCPGNVWAFRSMYLPLPDESGVYFVLDAASAVLYVGQSKQMHTRWRAHPTLPELRSRSEPIRIAYLLCPQEELLVQEARYLAAYQPRLNTPHEIARAINPATAVPASVTATQLSLLPARQRTTMQARLRAWGGCPRQVPFHDTWITACTGCWGDTVWCHGCLPWPCECWKYGRWLLASDEILDDVRLGIEDWLRQHPAQTLWDLDKTCQRIGGRPDQLAAFFLGHHWPTPWEVTLLAKALEPTAAGLR